MYIYKEVEVEVDLSDFDTDDLIEELENRGEVVGDAPGDNKELIVSIFEKKRLGKDYERELDELIYNVIGRII